MQRWPLRETFRIARGGKDEAVVVVAAIRQGDAIGYGEAVPYARYGESPASVLAQIASVQSAVEAGKDVQSLLPPGAARNAVDCALWDLKARLEGTSVAALSGFPWPKDIVTAQTIVIDTLDKMAASAARFQSYPLLKIKLDTVDILERVRAVHQGAPNARLIVDANESWDLDRLKAVVAPLADLNVVLIEQPLPQGHDRELLGFSSPIAICADESCHDAADVERLAPYYDAVNIKLDKAGGLSAAINAFQAARAHDLKIMVGCMVCTSLAIAPAFGLAAIADFADLDGPNWLAQDRANGFIFNQGMISAPDGMFWGV